jgi:hypothetical protein
MKIFKFLFQIILFGFSFASIIPHLFPNYWFTDIFSHFKLQYIILLLIFFPGFSVLDQKENISGNPNSGSVGMERLVYPSATH